MRDWLVMSAAEFHATGTQLALGIVTGDGYGTLDLLDTVTPAAPAPAVLVGSVQRPLFGPEQLVIGA